MHTQIFKKEKSVFMLKKLNQSELSQGLVTLQCLYTLQPPFC